MCSAGKTTKISSYLPLNHSLVCLSREMLYSTSLIHAKTIKELTGNDNRENQSDEIKLQADYLKFISWLGWQ